MLKMFVLTNSSARYASKNLSKLVSENPDLGGKRTGKLLAHFMNVVADQWAKAPLGPRGWRCCFLPGVRGQAQVWQRTTKLGMSTIVGLCCRAGHFQRDRDYGLKPRGPLW